MRHFQNGNFLQIHFASNLILWTHCISRCTSPGAVQRGGQKEWQLPHLKFDWLPASLNEKNFAHLFNETDHK